MKYTIEHLNNGEPIDSKTIEAISVNIIITDTDGNKYGLPIHIENLNIDELVLKEMEKYKIN